MELQSQVQASSHPSVLFSHCFLGNLVLHWAEHCQIRMDTISENSAEKSLKRRKEKKKKRKKREREKGDIFVPFQ